MLNYQLGIFEDWKFFYDADRLKITWQDKLLTKSRRDLLSLIRLLSDLQEQKRENPCDCEILYLENPRYNLKAEIAAVKVDRFLNYLRHIDAQMLDMRETVGTEGDHPYQRNALGMEKKVFFNNNLN